VGREARVLIAITSFAGKQSNIERGSDGINILTRAARVALETIADHTNLARRHVQTAIRGLEAKGILRPLRRAGYATEYQIIFKRGADGTNGTDGGTGYGAPFDENGTDGGTVFGPDGAPFLDLGGTEDGALTELADSRTEPLSSREEARARTREEGFSYNRVEEKQRVLLPIDGARERD
jgi:predicted transcriptional regulator